MKALSTFVAGVEISYPHADEPWSLGAGLAQAVAVALAAAQRVVHGETEGVHFALVTVVPHYVYLEHSTKSAMRTL